MFLTSLLAANRGVSCVVKWLVILAERRIRSSLLTNVMVGKRLCYLKSNLMGSNHRQNFVYYQFVIFPKEIFKTPATIQKSLSNLVVYRSPINTGFLWIFRIQ